MGEQLLSTTSANAWERLLNMTPIVHYIAEMMERPIDCIILSYTSKAFARMYKGIIYTTVKKRINKRVQQILSLSISDAENFINEVFSGDYHLSGSTLLQCLLGEEWLISDLDFYTLQQEPSDFPLKMCNKYKRMKSFDPTIFCKFYINEQYMGKINIISEMAVFKCPSVLDPGANFAPVGSNKLFEFMIFSRAKKLKSDKMVEHQRSHMINMMLLDFDYTICMSHIGKGISNNILAIHDVMAIAFRKLCTVGRYETHTILQRCHDDGLLYLAGLPLHTTNGLFTTNLEFLYLDHMEKNGRLYKYKKRGFDEFVTNYYNLSYSEIRYCYEERTLLSLPWYAVMKHMIDRRQTKTINITNNKRKEYDNMEKEEEKDNKKHRTDNELH